MRKCSLGLSLAVLFLAVLPFGCSDDSPSGKGSGGSSAGGSGGGSTEKGGSGGNSGGSGGQAGGSGGDTTGGSGGDASGGAGGTVDGGAGGTAVGGAGGRILDGGLDALGGAGGEAGDAAGNDGEPRDDAVALDGLGGIDLGGPTCDDKVQNDLETDIDCGGGVCPKCGPGQKCEVDGDCRSGACDGGTCSDPFAPDGTITQSGNLWKMTMGAMVLEIDSAVAARIVTFSIDDLDVLVDNMGNSTGSVFWTAPQSEWNDNGWPPPDALENSAYTGSSKDGVLTMKGPTWDGGLSVTKRFWGNSEHQAITIEYTISNATKAAVTKAPWEVTRVYPGGLTFFPNAEPAARLGNQSFLEVPFTSAEGALWFKYEATEFTQDVKGGADGLEGWAAHVMCGTGLERACTGTNTKSPVLIKMWPDQSEPAPEEREVEIYANAGHNYVEFEQQGAYESIPAGGSLVWTVHWLLRYLPSDVAPTAGSKELLDWVRSELL